eukprot:3186201-Prymnesium_polylepis.2
MFDIQIGATPLYAAVLGDTEHYESEHQLCMVNFLLERGADPHFVCREDGTSTFWCACATNDVDVLDVLYARGVDMN